MGLVDLTSVSSLLVCPRCGSGLTANGDRLVCGSASCDASRSGPFPRHGDWPVLVDFERSIIDSDDLSAGWELRRDGRRWSIGHLPRRLRAIWKPVNRVAERNVARLLSMLPERPLVLVIGGGTIGNGVGAIYADAGTRVLAFDVYASPATQFIADAHRIPLASGSVDA